MVSQQPLTAVIALVAALLYADSLLDFIHFQLPSPAGRVYPVKQSALPKRPRTAAVLASNSLLRDRAVRLHDTRIHSPETIAIAENGDLYSIDARNYLWRKAAGSALDEQPLMHLGPGRGLALEFDAAGHLYICIAGAGLYMLEVPSRRLSLLASVTSSPTPGSAILYAEDLALASNGTIYFTDATNVPPTAPIYDILRPLELSLFEGSMTGRLLAYNPLTKATEELLSGLWFANGCALALDESYILVTDTIGARILKFHLQGPKAGTSEILIDGLPGAPDNIKTARDGTFWVGLSGQLGHRMLKAMQQKPVRALVAWLPSALVPKKPYGAILQRLPEVSHGARIQRTCAHVQLAGDGTVLRFLDDPRGETAAGTSSVAEGSDGLYLGSFTAKEIGFIAYKDLPPAAQRA